MITKTNSIDQKYHIVNQRCISLKMTVKIYFLGIKIYQYTEDFKEEQLKEVSNNMGFMQNK